MRLVLRDGAAIEGGIYLTEGQALAQYLSSRRGGWVNLVNVPWASERGPRSHAVLQAEHILLVAPLEEGVPIHTGGANVVRRELDIALEDGTHVRGRVYTLERQRLCDYLAGCGRFLAVIGARRMPKGDDLGDIALNTGCVKAVCDANLPTEGQVPEVRASAPAPVNRDMVTCEGGAFEVITEGRVPDRREKRVYSPPAPEWRNAPEPQLAELTPQQRQIAERLSEHWLVQLGARMQLTPPDPRELNGAPMLHEIWSAIVQHNEMADAELAAHVATSFKLDVADVSRVSPEALRVVPEKLARKLGVLPLRIDGRSLDVAVSDPSSMAIEQQLRFVTRLSLRFAVASPDDIRAALDRHYGTRALPRDDRPGA